MYCISFESDEVVPADTPEYGAFSFTKLVFDRNYYLVSIIAQGRRLNVVTGDWVANYPTELVLSGQVNDSAFRVEPLVNVQSASYKTLNKFLRVPFSQGVNQVYFPEKTILIVGGSDYKYTQFIHYSKMFNGDALHSRLTFFLQDA